MAGKASGMVGESAKARAEQAAPMRLGFVGVGRHAQRMAAAFRECGAEIVAHYRKSLEPAEGFGPRKSIEWMLDFHHCDGVVCCAPPDVATKLAIDSEIYQQALCVSKPFPMRDRVWQAEHMSHPLYVDLWRLYSPAWLALKADLRGKTITSVHVDFYGNGPVRATHSGLLDYGVHALAFVLDLGLRPEFRWEYRAEGISPREGERFWFGVDDGRNIHVATGNEAHEPRSVVLVEAEGREYRWLEDDGVQLYEGMIWHKRDLALRNFCRAFLAGEPSDTLRISCEAMRLLRRAELW